MSVGHNHDHPGSLIEKAITPLPKSLLTVTNLTIQAKKRGEAATLVSDVSFRVSAGKTLALTGESGSGKTLTSLALVGLLPETVHQSSGEIRFNGKVLSQTGKHRFSSVRGAEIAMIFQEPLAALNPVFRVGHQIEDVVQTHRHLPSRLAREYALELLRQVDLQEPVKVHNAYPHQLSGGMAQRVMIAMALSCGPGLIIADEPTTALDVLTQGKILSLISELQKAYEFALLLISHDKNVVAQMADSIIEMDAGKIVEPFRVTPLPL
jgi:ABC-type glutathione transport system ATPase component